MAKISITFSGVVHYTDATNKVESKDNITLATDKVGCDAFLAVDEPATKFLKYSINIKDFSFQKKMYQPTEFIVTLGIASEKSSYQDINRKAIEKLFKYKQVAVNDAESTFSEGSEFYVHEVQPVYAKGSEMVVILKICSLDKLMTLQQACRTFVGKKLGEDILATETKGFKKPWTIGETYKIEDEDKYENIAYTTNMRILEYETGKEHIFPYLVQYNESFYDLLARTTNRWGEFMYFENDKLHIGYKNATPKQVSKDLVKNITFHNDSKQLKWGWTTEGVYDYEADSSNLDAQPIQESPNYVKGQMGAFGGEADKWIMDQFPNIFMNDENLPTMMGNMLFENVFNLAKEESKEAKRNAKHNKKYFNAFDKTSPQYSESYKFERDDGKMVEKRAFQEFTEINTSFTGEKYENILNKEQTTGRDAIYIDYDTRHPNLRLGDIVSFAGENYIVVEVKGGFDAAQNLVFMVVATAQDQNGLFYPAVIPAGHVRYAHPQIATITDATDPTKVHRARVRFSWESIEYDKKGKITEDTKKISSPWLTFASAQQGYPMAGKHYEGDRVMVGFEDGNVERPYIIGGLVDQECDEFNIDAILSSQGMHQLILTDGSGAGMQSFLAGALSPLTKTLMGFAPGLIPSWKWEKDKYFEGGFELTDNYGTYKISGSTNGRNVSIASNWGDVKIDAFTGISISAPNGDVSITGKNVSIKAGNNLTIESGTNVGYKLFDQWTLKDGTVDKRGTAENIMYDITTSVAKRLAEVALDVLDLSLVRSAVEIFFRPVEGCLSLKSHRFLKLAAGTNPCQYPSNVYKWEKKLEMGGLLIDVNLIPELQKVFQIIPSVCENLLEKYENIYSLIVFRFDDEKTLLEKVVNSLRPYANDANGEICKSYEDLKEEFWSQDKDEDWGEEKLGFTDNVAIKGKPEEIVTPNCFLLSIVNDIVGDKAKREEAISGRKRIRSLILAKYNELRKYIYDLTHMEPTKKDISQWFGHINGKKLPKEYQEKLLTAFSKQKCPEAICYKAPKGISQDDLKKRMQIDMENEIKYLRRVVTMNFLEELGFADKMRRSVARNPDYPLEVPPMPQANNKDASYELSIMNDLCWANYVNSLSVIPPLDIVAIREILDGPTEDPGLLEKQKDKMMFWKDVPEIKTWRSGYNGRILLGSGNGTYVLNDDRFEKIDSLNPSLSCMFNDEKYGPYVADALQLFTEKIGKTLLKI
jgi:Uncharacterized protein conserved in bacteria